VRIAVSGLEQVVTTYRQTRWSSFAGCDPVPDYSAYLLLCDIAHAEVQSAEVK
jgi:hypothetical protein